MSKFKMYATIAGLAAVALLGAACGNSPAPAAASPEPAAPAVTQPAPAVGAPSAPAVPIGAPAPAVSVRGESSSPAPLGVPSYSSSSLAQSSNGQSGIWVTGESVIMAEPDLATVNIGVETRGATVAEANRKAAEAMDSMVNTLKALGLTDRDIQTTSFNVWPQYEYNEVFENGRRVGKQELVGYQVSNSASIKIRNLDEIGEIIDAVAEAGGDATRINGVSFSVEDPKPFMADLREAAVKDAMDKAQQFADLTNTGLGRLVFITELGGSAPVVVQDFARGFAMEAAAAPAFSTPIQSGELQFRMSVQAVFDIQ